MKYEVSLFLATRYDNHVTLTTLVMFKWKQNPIELHSRLKVITLQSSVFVRGDLMLQLCSLYTRGMTLVMNAIRSLCSSKHNQSSE